MQPAPDLASSLWIWSRSIPLCVSAHPAWHTHTLLYTNTDSLCLWLTHTCKQTCTLSLALPHTDIQHIGTHKNILKEYTHTPFWKLQDWRPVPSLRWECIIWLGCRNVACCFISVQGWSLYFCLWMLSSCSSSPAPLPRLLQCL